MHIICLIGVVVFVRRLDICRSMPTLKSHLRPLGWGLNIHWLPWMSRVTYRDKLLEVKGV